MFSAQAQGVDFPLKRARNWHLFIGAYVFTVADARNAKASQMTQKWLEGNHRHKAEHHRHSIAFQNTSVFQPSVRRLGMSGVCRDSTAFHNMVNCSVCQGAAWKPMTEWKDRLVFQNQILFCYCKTNRKELIRAEIWPFGLCTAIWTFPWTGSTHTSHGKKHFPGEPILRPTIHHMHIL